MALPLFTQSSFLLVETQKTRLNLKAKTFKGRRFRRLKESEHLKDFVATLLALDSLLPICERETHFYLV